MSAEQSVRYMERMQELISQLNQARDLYYNGQNESPLRDKEYDHLLRELTLIELSTGITLDESPNKAIGAIVPDSERIVVHKYPILSIKDTKSIQDLLYFLGEEDGLLSWKLDGISLVLYYDQGKLQCAATRGDGEKGKDVTENVLKISGIPLTINNDAPLIIRGEGVISLDRFEQIKQTKEGEKYTHPRNTAAGLIGATVTSSVLLKHIVFVAHTAIHIDGKGRGLATRHEQFSYLSKLGFKVVPYVEVANYQLEHVIETFTNEVPWYEYPVDGLVLTYDNISYADSKGTTKRHPRYSMAFKWPDEEYITSVTDVKWSISRTGLITPIVIFKPVMIDGSLVRKANLHNLKRFKELKLGKDDKIVIYKANRVIPEVAGNIDGSGTFEYPRKCPNCQKDTTIVRTDITEKLYCYNCSTH